MAAVFRWIVAPAGLLAAYVIVERHVTGRLHTAWVSYLSGMTMGLYFGLLHLTRRNSG
jgi:hypothetical protein